MDTVSSVDQSKQSHDHYVLDGRIHFVFDDSIYESSEKPELTLIKADD